MTSQIGFYLAAMLAGVAFVVQQAANTGLRSALGSGLWAALANFVVGMVAILAVLAFQRESLPSLAAAGRAPWYLWIGGLLGAVYIVGAIFVVPRIGTATFFGLILVGQMLASLTFDHFGLLGLPVHEAGLPRIVGAALLVLGAGLILAF